MTVSFTVPGKPMGKGRPRFYGGRAITPGSTREYEKMTAMLYGMAAHGVFFPAGVAVRVEIVVHCPIPSKARKAERERMRTGEVSALGKPDADNAAKIILDALNGVAYADDAQVAELTVCKRYAEEPCVTVTVSAARTETEVIRCAETRTI